MNNGNAGIRSGRLIAYERYPNITFSYGVTLHDPRECFDMIVSSGPVSREKVLRLEEFLRTLPQQPERVTHHFSPGVYVRELFIPKGMILTGKVHRFAHLNIMPKGDISVLTEHGLRRLKGPCTLMSSPGIKRAGFAHEDTIWMTVHPNPDNERDVETLERRYVTDTFEEFDGLTVEGDRLCLSSLPAQ